MGPPARRSEPVRLLASIRWAWNSHRELPYRWSEVWTRSGRHAHYRRWVEQRAEAVRAALQRLGMMAPSGWSAEDLGHIHEVVVEGCYDVDGFSPKEDELVIDAGCEWGDFTLECARAGARVFAFDPSQENVRHARELLSANGLEAQVQSVALDGRSGVVRLGQIGSTTFSVQSTNGGAEFPARSIDDLALTDVRLLKIDVEGMELEVLRGGAATIARDLPRIVVEVHGISRAREVYRFLERLHYSLARRGSRKRVRGIGWAWDTFWTPPELPTSNLNTAGSPGAPSVPK